MMNNIKMLLEFDGTNYSGWLKQSDESIITVQSAVEKSLYNLLGKYIEVTGCSRTDAGVHGLNYVVNFKTDSTIPPNSMYKALNPFLPDAIKAKSSEKANEDFHAVYSAKKKTYRYYFCFGEIEKPLYKNRVWNAYKKMTVSQKKILELTNKAASELVGTYDFSAFKAAGGIAKTSVRTIYSAKVKSLGKNLFCLEICGDGFLYNMVRIIAGTLVYVAIGKIQPNDIKSIIESKDRKKAGITAPAHGLYLYKVYY